MKKEKEKTKVKCDFCEVTGLPDTIYRHMKKKHPDLYAKRTPGPKPDPVKVALKKKKKAEADRERYRAKK